MKYKAKRSFQGNFGGHEIAWDEGAVVELEPDIAAWVCRDLGDPEALAEQKERAVEKPPTDRLVRGRKTRSK